MERQEGRRGSALRYALAVLVAVGVIAAAERTSSAKGPCADDIQKYCKDVKSGKGKIGQCLKEHEADLSPACKERVAQVADAVRDLYGACHVDVEKLCKDVPPAGKSVEKCLKEHQDELSTACKSRIVQMKDRKQ